MRGHTREKARRACWEEKKNKGTEIRRGKQRLKQRAGESAGLANIEITDKNIKAFTAVAKKYHVDFARKKDTTAEKPVFAKLDQRLRVSFAV